MKETRRRGGGEDSGRNIVDADGAEAMDIYCSFNWGSEAEKHDISQVKQKFARYFRPRTNVTYERCKFLQRNQELGETFDAFLTDLKNLISSCKYRADERDNLLRGQFMMNITSSTVHEKLLPKAELKLAETIGICGSTDISGQLMAGMNQHEQSHAVKFTSSSHSGDTINDSWQRSMKRTRNDHGSKAKTCKCMIEYTWPETVQHMQELQ